MLTKEIKYIDVDGKERVDTFYFNLTKAEILEYNANYDQWGGILGYMTHLSKHITTMQPQLIASIKDLIMRSYGERTANGRFIKNEELREAFAASEAYSELFLEIVNNQDALSAFINGVVPQVPEEQRAAAEAEVKKMISLEQPPVG